jgi:hypothetical protein
MPATLFNRRRLLAGGAGLTAGAAVLGGPDVASAGGLHLSADDVVAIHNLKAGYAYGSDALARGDEVEGRARYHAVFTDDAHITSLPDIDVIGPDRAADRVLEVLAGAGATKSQHLLGTIELTMPDGGRGRNQVAVRAYVQATVILGPDGLLRVLATYDDVAVRTRAGWRLSSSAATTLNAEVVPPPS